MKPQRPSPAPRSPRGVIGAAVLLLAAVLWVALRGASPAGGTDLPAPAGELSARASDQELLAPPADADSREAATRESPAPAGGDLPTGSDAAPDDRFLAGTIAVVDSTGAEHPHPKGILTVVCWSSQGSKRRDVLVTAGRWELELPVDPPTTEVSVESARLGNKAAACDLAPWQRIAVPRETPLVLRARWEQELLLHVRDAATGRELDPVEILPAPWKSAGPSSLSSTPSLVTQGRFDFGPTLDIPSVGVEMERFHPGAGAKGVLTGASPLALKRAPGGRPFPSLDPGLAESGSFFVRSPGYAWGFVEAGNHRGGERFVFLEPGGDLEVVIAGDLSKHVTRVALLRPNGVPCFEDSLRAATSLSIEGLLPGEVRVRATVGDRSLEGAMVGEAIAQIVAGSRTRVVLTVTPPPARGPVLLSGTLSLSGEWRLPTLHLILRPAPMPAMWRERIDVAALRELGDGEHAWDAGEVEPGAYLVEISPIGFMELLEVPAGGRRDARIVVPPPANLFVQCVDEDTGRKARVSTLSCSLGITRKHATWNGDLEGWQMRVPVGEQMIWTAGEDYGATSHAVTVEPGDNVLVLRLARRASFQVTLADGSNEIPWDPAWPLELTPAEGQAGTPPQERARAGQLALFSPTIHEKEPGAYTFQPPVVPGFETAQASIVKLERGRVTRLVVALRRKK